MKEQQELVKLLCTKINECDDLIVEISQLRYQLEEVLYTIGEKADQPILQQPNKNPA